MSHLISGPQLQGILIFNLTPHQIVKPRIKRYLLCKSPTLESFGSAKIDKAVMQSICKRYTKIQKQNIEKEKQMFIGQQCSALKKKFKSILNPKSRNVSTFFEEHEDTLQNKLQMHSLNLKKLREGMPRRIELQKKYNTNLSVKMRAIDQARQIDKMKQDYHRHNNQLRENCPNFRKMNFLLERMFASPQKHNKTEPNMSFSPQKQNKNQRNNSFCSKSILALRTSS